MIRLIIGIVIGLLIGTYFGIKLQVSDLTGSMPMLSNMIQTKSPTISTLETQALVGQADAVSSDATQISESIGSSVSYFFKSPEFQSIVSQIQANPSQTQSILQQALPSLLTQIIKQKVATSGLSSLSALLGK